MQYISSMITSLFYKVLQKRQVQFTVSPCTNVNDKIFELQNCSYTWKESFCSDMLSRFFTKAELQINQLKHKQPPPQKDFAVLQNNTFVNMY